MFLILRQIVPKITTRSGAIGVQPGRQSGVCRESSSPLTHKRGSSFNNFNRTDYQTRLYSQSPPMSNMKRLQGKVAIVTASTDGIGFAIAKRLAEDGASVVISSRKQNNVDKAVDQLQQLNLSVMGLKCHVALTEDRKRLFDETIFKYGKLNILVSNAATNPAVGGVLECDESVWDKIFEVNVKASYLLAKEALPYLRKEKGSNIVFVSSIAGYDAFELLGAYSVSKTALIGLTKAAAKDLAPECIRVNCLAPGIIKTKFSRALHESETAHEAAVSKIPMGRLGTPEEMAGVVSFLVSDDAAYITGETIVASGGMSGRL